jgi:hypothetical protein
MQLAQRLGGYSTYTAILILQCSRQGGEYSIIMQLAQRPGGTGANGVVFVGLSLFGVGNC